MHTFGTIILVIGRLFAILYFPAICLILTNDTSSFENWLKAGFVLLLVLLVVHQDLTEWWHMLYSKNDRTRNKEF